MYKQNSINLYSILKGETQWEGPLLINTGLLTHYKVQELPCLMNKAPARGNYFLLLIMASTSVGPKDQYDGEQKLEVIYGSPKHVCFLTTSEGEFKIKLIQ